MGRKIFASLVALFFLYVVSPLLLPVVMGGVFAILFFPILERMERRKFSTAVSSAILTLGITLLVLIPASILTFLGAKAGIEQVQQFKNAPKIPGGSWIENILSQERFRPVMDFLAGWFPDGMQQLIATMQEVSLSIGLKLGELMGSLVTALPGMVMAVAVIMVSVYFFLIDGRKLVYFMRRNSMFGPMQTDQLMKTFEVTCRSVILASVVSGAVQSFVFLIFCLATGVPNAFLAGFLVFLGSFIPVVGSAPVTFGTAIYQLLIGNTTAGVVVLIGAVIVSIIDNIVRPVFLRGAANLHPLLAFVAAFGGLQALGFAGIFLGPIIAAVFTMTLQILTAEQDPSEASVGAPTAG